MRNKPYEVNEAEGYTQISVVLQHRETELIILNQESGACVNDKVCAETGTNLGDWTQRFHEVSQEKNCITYQMDYETANVCGDEYFSVHAEEMVECYCNGQFVDVFFWEPYMIPIGKFLKPGKNEIKLVITGNAANIYDEVNIPYGL